MLMRYARPRGRYISSLCPHVVQDSLKKSPIRLIWQWPAQRGHVSRVRRGDWFFLVAMTTSSLSSCDLASFWVPIVTHFEAPFHLASRPDLTPSGVACGGMFRQGLGWPKRIKKSEWGLLLGMMEMGSLLERWRLDEAEVRRRMCRALELL